jgi:4-diphosphocytidyl-2-C-methyl-D-erythritol kinase
MLLRAFAKINLDLRVAGRRDDGYHEVGTILQTIDWFDEIHIEEANNLEFTASRGPSDETNLVLRAVKNFERLADIKVKLRIGLSKNIPIGAGLGGGSADAAVTILGLQRWFDKTLEAPVVWQLLRGLGSDVPFFWVGGRAAGLGRGDEVYPLEDEMDYWLVLVDPGITILTHEAYSWLTVLDKPSNIEGFRAQFLSECGAGPAVNDFQAPVFARYPDLGAVKEDLVRLGAYRAALSCSGSTVFGQFREESRALEAASVLSGRFQVHVTKPLPRLEYFHRMFADA